MLGFQARAMLKGLAKHGEPSLLAGSPCGKVAIERNVTEDAGIGDTADDNPIVRVIVATFDASYAPRVGQTLVHPTEGTFRLDRLHTDSGVIRRYVVVPKP